MVYDLRFVTAKAAARVAFGRSGLNVGNGRILCDSMNLQTAMGMKTLFVSNISFMTLSAKRVLCLVGDGVRTTHPSSKFLLLSVS
jgi:hypothetical protein